MARQLLAAAAAPGVSPGPPTRPPALTSQWPARGGGGRSGPGPRSPRAGGGPGREASGPARVGREDGAAPRPGRPGRSGGRAGAGVAHGPASRRRRAALTCAARAIAHSAADAQRLRRSRGRRPAAPPRGRTAPALGKRPPAPRRARAAPATIAWHNSPELPRPKSGRRRPAPSPGPPRGRCHAGKAHRRPRRSLPPALRPCRNAAARAGATLPCAAAAGGRGRWPLCGPVGGLCSLGSAAPSLDQAVSSLPSELGSAGIRRRAG